MRCKIMRFCNGRADEQAVIAKAMRKKIGNSMTEKTAPRRRAAQMSPEARKKQLIECAMIVFSEHGFSSSAIHTHVARVAGVSVPTVFSYFPTRFAIIEAVVRDVQRGIFAIIDKNLHDQTGLSVFDRLLGVVRGWAEAAETNPILVRVFLNWSSSFQPEVEALYQEYVTTVVQQLESIIRDGQKNGEFDKEVDVHDAALIIQGSGHLIAHLKFSKYESRGMMKFLHNIVRGALQAELG